jgi:hypothetical protein
MLFLRFQIPRLEEIMTRILMTAMVALWFGVISLYAQSSRSSYQLATVVHVHEQMMPANLIGGVIDDTIPQPQEYFYDVSVGIGCDVYVIRYESPINQLPVIFSLGSSVDVRVDRDRMNVALPGGGGVLRLGIVSSHRSNDRGCVAN